MMEELLRPWTGALARSAASIWVVAAGIAMCMIEGNVLPTVGVILSILLIWVPRPSPPKSPPH